MVNIICNPELRQEIYDWIVRETDIVTEDSEKYSWLGVGVDTYYLNPTIVDSGLKIECGEDDAEEIYSKRFPFTPDEWILGFFENLKKQYPLIEMSGTIGILDKSGANYYGVKASANSAVVEFKKMYQCIVCGKLTDNPGEVDDFDDDYSECICSPECAVEYALRGGRGVFENLPSFADQVLTKENVIPLLEVLEREMEDDEEYLDQESFLAAKAVLIEYANRFGSGG